jgi:hypothetical protein
MMHVRFEKCLKVQSKKPEGKRSRMKYGHSWNYNIKTDLKYVVGCFELTQDWVISLQVS